MNMTLNQGSRLAGEVPDTRHFIRVNELKNYVYCPRTSFYALCLGLDRETGLSRSGVLAEERTKARMKRRKHALHGVVAGERHFDVMVFSQQLQLVGRVDEIVATEAGLHLVDYKDAVRDHGYWEIQMTAYRVCAEDTFGVAILGQYVYDVSQQRYEPVKVSPRTIAQLNGVLDALHHMIRTETCPAPTSHAGKCNVCQYARFCNDVR